jgi:hypothetical protein
MIDQVILSCNEDPVYSEFWPVVSAAYVAMGFRPHLALLTNKHEFDPVIQEYRKYGQVTVFRPLPDIPEFGQAKMIRFILASMQKNDVCYIDDIDLYPLDRKFITDKVVKRPQNVLLCVGGEVYGFNGCYPISQMTGEGYLWRAFINPKDLNYSELLQSWKYEYFYDERERLITPVVYDEKGGFKDDKYFSDERLLKRLLVNNPVPKLELKRGYDNYLDATIDRATVNQETGEWVYDREKLKNNGFVNAHCARPYSKFKDQMEPLINYIKENYGG